MSAPNIGSVFTRWGNGSAPAGTTLIYWGYGYGIFYADSGGNKPIVMNLGATGPAATTNGNDLCPLTTYAVMPPGITARCYVKAAVCLSDAPVIEIWGTQTAPVGWEVVYRGYAMGSQNSAHNPNGPICVDADAFDASAVAPGTYESRLYGTRINTAVPGSGNTAATFVPCAVCKKSAGS